MSKTPVGEVRPSLLLWTYGPGALIDLPNLSVVTMGIDRWEIGRCQPIQEARLLTNVRRVLGDQVEERGYDGEVGWQYVAGVLRQDDPQMNEISREDSILHWYFGLAERGIKLTLEPPRDKDFDGQPRVLDGVRWTVMARPEATKTLWFDRDTGLLVEERVEAKADDATTILQRMIYNDYREVDGVQGWSAAEGSESV